MYLLDTSEFSQLFDDLINKSVGFVVLDGNAGDLMIQHATVSKPVR